MRHRCVKLVRERVAWSCHLERKGHSSGKRRPHKKPPVLGEEQIALLAWFYSVTLWIKSVGHRGEPAVQQKSSRWQMRRNGYRPRLPLAIRFSVFHWEEGRDPGQELQWMNWVKRLFHCIVTSPIMSQRRTANIQHVLSVCGYHHRPAALLSSHLLLLLPLVQ